MRHLADGPDVTRVCPACFSDRIFNRRVTEVRAKSKNREPCDRHPKRKGVDLDLIGPTVDAAFRANFGIGQFIFDHQEGDELWAIIADITGAEDEEVAYAIAEWLVENDDYWPPDGGEPFFANDYSYVRIRPGGWEQSALWGQFRSDVLNRQRFFNADAKALLSQIFDGIHLQADAKGRPAFYQIEPSSELKLYRARVVTGENQAREIAKAAESEMGTPPLSLRRAGRMNAAGIPVFYGALEEQTAVAELRPAVGAELCVAAFQLIRPMYVLDFTRFTGSGKQINMFSLNYLKRKTQWSFMLSFANEISRPILPSDEHLEYVPTQVVAEYLASMAIKWNGKDVNIEAIVFRSAQRPEGRNIVVLGDAAIQKKENQSKRPDLVDLSAIDDLFSLETSRSESALSYVDRSLKYVQVQSARFMYKDSGGFGLYPPDGLQVEF